MEEEGEKEEAEVFKKSAVMVRSPVKGRMEGWEEMAREMRVGFKEVMKEIKEVKEGREEMKGWMEEMRKGWEKERKMFKEKMEGMEKRLEELEEREKKREVERGEGRTEGGEGGREWGEIRDEWEERMRRLEVEGERKSRGERKRNIIIRGVKTNKEGEEGLREAVEEVVKETGVEVKIEEVRRVGKKDREGKEMVWVRFAKVEEKMGVMREKRKLRERKEWITDDLTEKERRIEWLIRVEADRKRREGKRVRVGYMKLWVEGKLWIWDEIKDRLKEGTMVERRGEGRREERRSGGGEEGNGFL